MQWLLRHETWMFLLPYKTMLPCGLLTIIRCFCPTALIFAFLCRNGRHWYTSTTSRIKVWGQKFYQGVIIITMVQFTLENNHEKESSGHFKSSVSLTITTWAQVLSYDIHELSIEVVHLGKWNAGQNFKCNTHCICDSVLSF